MSVKRSTNLGKLKKRQEQKAEARRGIFWRPREDETKVRLLPSQDEEKDFYYETGYHTLGEAYRNCVKFKGEKCPVCEHVRKLYKGTASDVELAKTLKLKKQYLFNAVIRGDEFIKNDAGEKTEEVDVKLMQVGVRVYEKIINAMLDEGIGDITDADKGFDLIIKRDMRGQYPDYSGTYVARQSTKMFEGENSDKLIDYALTHVKDPDQYIKYTEAETLQKELSQYLETGVVESPSSNEKKEEKKEEPKQETKSDAIPEDKPAEEKPVEKAAEKPAEENKEEPKTEEKSPDAQADFKKWEEEFDKDVK